MSDPAFHETDTWRSQVLQHFSPEIAKSCRVTVVADPDGLLLDDAVSAQLIAMGFDVVPYRDAVAFRYYYETLHRSKWDAGEHTSLVVSVPLTGNDLGSVPDDVLAAADRNRRVIELSLARLFPQLASRVLGDLDRADLDAVWAASAGSDRDPLGTTQTQDLVLRAVFKLSQEMITTAEDLLAQLLRLHHRDQTVPRSLVTRFTQAMNGRPGLSAWPIEELITSRDLFYRFLQERWPRHLAGIDSTIECPPLHIAGPHEIDFGSSEIATVIDNLFAEGLLNPIPVPDSAKFAGRWEKVGVEALSPSRTTESIREQITELSSTIPEPAVPPTVWARFAQRWAGLLRLTDCLSPSERDAVGPALDAAHSTIDHRLMEWLPERFGSLANRAFLPMPTMVHQIPHFLAHKRSAGDRIALLIVDGMSISQWLTVKDAVTEQWGATVRLEEAVVFAWIPSITSISRQAMLSGQMPLYFGSSIDSTSAEERHWKAFWENRGWKRDRVALVKHRQDEPEASLLARANASITDDRTECIAVILNSLDRMVHGAGPDASVLSAAVEQWARNGHVSELIRLFLKHDFTVAIASDHGNVQATGIGRPNLGSIPDGRGQRAIMFPDDNTRSQVHEAFPDTIEWRGHGLPEEMRVLLASGRGAFVSEAASLRTHGGASMEEILVPFVTVSSTV